MKKELNRHFQFRKAGSEARATNKKEEQKSIWSYVEEYPPKQWEYERKCIFNAKGNTRPDEAFAFMNKLVPSRANAFLFDKRNKF